jgi:arylsulfatase A-like enzyme
VIQNSQTFMDHFHESGYHTLGTGKIMHSGARKEWVEYGNDADYSPLAHRDGKNVAHPNVPAPFRDDFESIDGSFGPLRKVEAPFSWKSGSWRELKDFKYNSENDRNGDRGSKLYDQIIKSYCGDRELALKTFIQAYLASVASVDDLIGNILDTIEGNSLKDNTVIILTSDHGWSMGEKRLSLQKFTLAGEHTRAFGDLGARPGQAGEMSTAGELA